ncbi:MAG: hypothetical protein GY737_16840 [Desulfobacteraceae bacterium]|nr:hypothetical protein [Desulfobacteraceae bacterium]
MGNPDLEVEEIEALELASVRLWPALPGQEICPERFELRRTHACDGGAAFGAPLDPKQTTQILDIAAQGLHGAFLRLASRLDLLPGALLGPASRLGLLPGAFLRLPGAFLSPVSRLGLLPGAFLRLLGAFLRRPPRRFLLHRRQQTLS